MNDQLQATVAETLKQAVELAQQGGEFLKGQLPDVLSQLLMWKMTQSLLWFSIAASLFLGLAFLSYKAVQWTKRSDRWADQEGLAFLAVAAGFASIGSGIVALFNLTWLKILIAPKVFLLEYAASLVR